MPVEMSVLTRSIDPRKTVLLFGAGASIPSGAPSVSRLQEKFEEKFSVPREGYTLSEQTGIIENQTKDRKSLIKELQSMLVTCSPTGAILNLPLYEWKGIYTTNYDTIIEKSFQRKDVPLSVMSCDYDFGSAPDGNAVLYKIHGTIEKDISFGDKSRIILTDADYDLTDDYREKLYMRLASDISDSNLVIIGHSLADKDIRDIINKSASLNKKSYSIGQIWVVSFSKDEGRTSLLENRGIKVAFGDLDHFFAGIIDKLQPEITVNNLSSDPLDKISKLRPRTIDIFHSAKSTPPNISAMYNGWPATYADIANGNTFIREASEEISKNIEKNDVSISLLIGASGVGKTTAARQALTEASSKGILCWEHKELHVLDASSWIDVIELLEKNSKKGVLFIDEAHDYLQDINSIVNYIYEKQFKNLHLILCTSNYSWSHRIKTPTFFRICREIPMSKVSHIEVDRLLSLIEKNNKIKDLVESNFAGFSRAERRRRLMDRCEADMFVCLKHIFSSTKFDDILLREYASLDAESQELYKFIAILESSGVHVHRQLALRLLGIKPDAVYAMLQKLSDIIREETMDEKQGIYLWKGRHKQIMEIISAYKIANSDERYKSLENVIDAISPTYNIEIRTIRDLCNLPTGVRSIIDKEKQNILFRKMISVAPGERIPRHRLIGNLIHSNHFDQADTEIRIFENSFRRDGSVARYKVLLSMARATRSPGLQREDRIHILKTSLVLAENMVKKFHNNKHFIITYCELGIEIARLTGSADVYRDAMKQLKQVEDGTGDADISQKIRNLERRFSRIDISSSVESEIDLDDIEYDIEL